MPFKYRIIKIHPKYLPFIFFSIVLVSCTTSYGEKYTIGHLEIFYTESISNEYVEKLGKYFDDHGLIQDQTHSVQLTSDPMGSENPGFVLKMILNKDYKSLPEEMETDLSMLEEDIKNEVFEGLNFRIEVCDDNFMPIK